MNPKLHARLDPIYRCADDLLEVISRALPHLARYAEEVNSNGRFTPEVREILFLAACAAADLVTLLAAVHRDVGLLDDEGDGHVTMTRDGVIKVEAAESLMDEMRRLLAKESQEQQERQEQQLETQDDRPLVPVI